jgi:type IV secretion system protein VirB6
MKKLTKFMMVSIIILLLVVVVLEILGTFGALGFTNGCLLRYNIDNNNQASSNTQITDSFILNANGYYGDNLDPKLSTSYGKWLKTKVFIPPASVKQNPVTVSVTGEVSLCKSYVPKNNLQSDYNYPKQDVTERIEIPRAGSGSSLPLIFNAKKYGASWRNVVDATPGDRLILTVNPNYTLNSTPSFTNSFNDVYGENPSYNCTPGLMPENSPLCGRYAVPWVDGVCQFKKDPIPKPSRILKQVTHVYYVYKLFGMGLHYTNCDTNYFSFNPQYDDNDSQKTSCYLGTIFNLPPTDWDRDPTTIDWGFVPSKQSATSTIYKEENEKQRWPEDCNKVDCGICPLDPSKKTNQSCDIQGVKFNEIWFTADHYLGLNYRVVDSKNNELPNYNSSPIKQILTTDPQSTKKYLPKESPPDIKIHPYSDGKSPPYAIYNSTLDKIPLSSLESKYQLRFEDQASSGGYVVNVQHTKCIRTNGEHFLDSGSEGKLRGEVQYLIIPSGTDPNKDPVVGTPTPLTFDKDGNSNHQISMQNVAGLENGGYLWFKIDNAQKDYKDSFGNYNLKISYSIPGNNFIVKILDPIMKIVKDKIFSAAENIFARMTCSGKYSSADCTNYINWIRAILTMYIIFTGMQFILGMSKFNAHELLIRVIKIIVIGGLINEKTFIFFRTDIFPLIHSTIDEIISNISGYSSNMEYLDGNGSKHTLTAPFVFINTFMTRIFFSPAFYAQLLSTFSMGLLGIPFFIIICYAVILALKSVTEVIANYLMAIMFLGLLIIIAPIFLVFMLFERTRYLFNNWVSYVVRYSLEPVLIIAGLIILLQLHEIYLDQILGYSVCWKCAWPVKLGLTGITLIGIPGFDPTMTLFCLNWFVPWGYSYNDPEFGISFYDIVGLLIISQCMSHYIEFITQASGQLLSGSGTAAAPSISSPATEMGAQFNKYMGDKLSKTSLGEYVSDLKKEASNVKDELKSGWIGKDKYDDPKNFWTTINKLSTEAMKAPAELKEDIKSLPANMVKYAASLPKRGINYISEIPGRALNATIQLPSRALGKIIPDEGKKLMNFAGEKIVPQSLKDKYDKNTPNFIKKAISTIAPRLDNPGSIDEQLDKEMKNHLYAEKSLLKSIRDDGSELIRNSDKNETVREKAKFGEQQPKSYSLENAMEKVRRQEVEKHIEDLKKAEREKLKSDPIFKNKDIYKREEEAKKRALEAFRTISQERLDELRDRDSLNKKLEQVEDIIDRHLRIEIKTLKELGYNLSNNDIVQMVDDRRKYIPFDQLVKDSPDMIEKELHELSETKIQDYIVNKEVTLDLSKKIKEQNNLGKTFTKEEIQKMFDEKKAIMIQKLQEKK